MGGRELLLPAAAAEVSALVLLRRGAAVTRLLMLRMRIL